MSSRYITRRVLAGVFIVLGALHFVFPDPYVEMMPRYLPEASYLPLVYLSGVFEILGGIGVLVPALRRLACWGLIALLVAVFPANIQWLLNAIAEDATARIIIGIVRLPLQPLLIYWVWTACKER